MIEIKNKAFNEIFLSEISKFDSRKYAYDTFFNCSSDRFSQIAREYRIQNGTGALNYMYKTFHSWKSNYVRPNGSSSYNIVASTAATFTIEEKFVEAYTQLARYIENKFPKKIQLKEVNTTFEKIIDTIHNFNLKEATHYSKYIYKGDELQNYQDYIQLIFEFYTKTIFENLNKDLGLFEKTYNDIHTAFLVITFHTYLYNVEVNIRDTANKKISLKKVFELNHPVSYEDLLNNELSNFSVDQISEIAKANNTTKIDAFLTEIEIERIVNKKKEIENSKRGGTIQYILKTNSGILNIKLRILSPYEKAIIISRVTLFLGILIALANYCFVITNSFLIFVVGLFVSSFLITPIYQDILNLFKDIVKTKPNGR
jgi:hypothetical protein